MSNSQKNFLSIRSKLVAAVAMLLVASFMVVSSTYAWFTLSTAPEVTGITTQVGANGNLEIALYDGKIPQNGIGAGFNTDAANKTWGNILNLDLEEYGLNTIVLKPSALVLSGATTGDADNLVINTDIPLATPEYGSDGRIKELKANGFFGKYSQTSNSFEKSNGYGVRALGTVSSMTPQQLLYTSATAQLKSSLAAATKFAENSLNNVYERVLGPTKDSISEDKSDWVMEDVLIGGKLVTILLKGGLNESAYYDVKGETTADGKNELGALEKMIEQLEYVPDELENAVKNYMLMGLANTQAQKDATTFAAIKTAFDANWDDIFTQMQAEGWNGTITVDMPEGTADVSVELPEILATHIKFTVSAYKTISDKIETASDIYTTKKDAAIAAEPYVGVSWTDVRAILESLMDINKVTVAGKTLDEIMAITNKVQWAMGFVSAPIPVCMPVGSGVYADIASVNKNINVTFLADIDVVYGGNELVAPDMTINMFTNLDTDTDKDTKINIRPLTLAMPEPPADKTQTESNAAISDTYAYVLDFAFRTNADGSNLLLQQDAIDRIYSDNKDTASDTWGGGSYMELSSTSDGFYTMDVINLMKNIRIVFVNTTSGEILAGAGLDTTKATVDGANVKAAIKLCTVTAKQIEHTGVVTLAFGDFIEGDQVITALSKNQETYISAYVYLDGETVTNADVAAFASASAKGLLNLQFASSSKLVPMDYSDLKNQASAEQTTDSTSASSETPAETTATQG